MTYKEVVIPVNVTKKDVNSFFALKVKMANVISNGDFSYLSRKAQVEKLDESCRPLYGHGYRWIHREDQTYYIHPIWIIILKTLKIIKEKDVGICSGRGNRTDTRRTR